MALESLILAARGTPFIGSLDVIGGATFTDARAAIDAEARIASMRVRARAIAETSAAAIFGR